MSLGPLAIGRHDAGAWRVAAAGLILGAALVGLAIWIGWPLSRAINPIAAILWVGSGVLLAMRAPRPERRELGWIAAIVAGVVLAAFVRPSGFGETIAAFGFAGALVTLAAGDRVGAWALLAPAVYLPVHLAIGIGRAVMRGGGVRTDPPPTAALVPLAMVLAAAVGGALVAALLRRKESSSGRGQDQPERAQRIPA
jgi:hypothetical protein